MKPHMCPICEGIANDHEQVVCAGCDTPNNQGGSDWAPYTLRERRILLADWLYRERAGAPYTTAQIVDVSGIYNRQQGRWDKCRTDLLRLKANGVVRLVHGHPSRWEHARG